MTDDEGHVELVRVPLVRVEGVGQLVLGLPGQDVVAVELAPVRLDVQRLHSKHPEVVSLLVRQDVVVKLERDGRSWSNKGRRFAPILVTGSLFSI